MLFDKPNAELLMLVALCKDVPCGHQFTDIHLFGDANIERLECEGLIYRSSDSRHYRATKLGYDLLQRNGYEFQADEVREYNSHVLIRREECAQVMLTLLMAGIDVFTDGTPETVNDYVYLSSSYFRRVQRTQGRNTLGNSRFAGVMGNGYVFYYLADAQDALYYKYELRAAENLLDRHRRNCSAVVYMGVDYQALCTAVTGPAGTTATYRGAYDKFPEPVYLCPCNPDGAIQMRIMLQPNYRARLIKAILGAPPMPDPLYDGCDGVIDSGPFILGVDMDLRRITAMVQAVRNTGAKANIIARRSQCDALSEVLPSEHVHLYALKDEQIQEVFSFSSLLADPPIEPYITKGGEYIDDETIRACREARKARRKKDKPLQKEDEG